MNIEQLIEIGFEKDSAKDDGIYNYYLTSRDDREVFIQISTRNTDIIPVLL